MQCWSKDEIPPLPCLSSWTWCSLLVITEVYFPCETYCSHACSTHWLEQPFSKITHLLKIPMISAYTWWNCQATNDRHHLSWHYVVHLSGFSGSGTECSQDVRSGWTDPHHDHKAATRTTGPDPAPAPSDVGRRISEFKPCYKVPLSVCTRNVTCRGVSCGWTREMFRTLKYGSVSER